MEVRDDGTMMGANASCSGKCMVFGSIAMEVDSAVPEVESSDGAYSSLERQPANLLALLSIPLVRCFIIRVYFVTNYIYPATCRKAVVGFFLVHPKLPSSSDTPAKPYCLLPSKRGIPFSPIPNPPKGI